MSRHLATRTGVLLATLLSTSVTQAQDAAKKEYVDVKIAEPPKDEGLELTIKNAVTMSLMDNRDVVGVTPNGSTYAFGLKFDGTATYRKNKHEWRTIVGIAETLTRTPALPQVIKSADAAALNSTYLYFAKPWLGPFARFSMATQLFRGYDVRAAPTLYAITRANGSTDTITRQGGERFELTTPFAPITMKETVGPFARPITSEKINIETRIGLGALQTLADKQLLINDDDKTTDKVEVKELTDVLQAGGEASVELWGALYAKKITYKAGIGVLVPFWSNEKDVNPAKFTSLDIGVALSFKIVEWASLDYELKAIRQPQLLEAWQIRNGFMLTLGLGVEKKPKAKEPPKEDPKPTAK